MRLPDCTRLWLLVTMALLLPLAAAAAPASDADRDAAKAAVDATVDSVMAVLNDEAMPIGQKRSAIEAIAYERFDFTTISKLVLARNWRRMTPAQRQEFEQEFKRHLSVTYGDSLDRYGDETVEITDSRAERNGDVTVRSRILGTEEPLSVDYRMRSHNGSWYVIDVIVEGVSLLSNFRSQTQEIISAEGPEGLIQKLREKNEGREG
jgi:phospholipid transport system substrate-binding protein